MVTNCFLVCFITLLSSLFYLGNSKEASVTFYNGGMAGNVIFSQETENDDVFFVINIDGLDHKAGDFHINSWPVSFGGSNMLISAYDHCDEMVVGNLYNPTSANLDVNYTCSPDNYEGCAAGDLSGRYLGFNDLTTVFFNHTDPGLGLTLFGKNSIIGRSFVIDRIDGTPWVCATIMESGSSDGSSTNVVATFEYPEFYGTFSFVENEQVTLFSSLRTTRSVDSISFMMYDKNYLEYDSCEAMVQKDGDVSTSGIWNMSFSQDASKSGWSYAKAVWTLESFNFDLELFFTKSLVAQVDDKLYCGSFGKTAYAVFDSAGISGKFIFNQIARNYPLLVKIELDGLGERADAYHVHQLPTSLDNPTDCLLTSGHFNPYKVPGGAGQSGTYICSQEEPDQCEAGDLAGRNGGLANLTYASLIYYDDHRLNLFGTTSILGRSIVIHAVSGSRLACASILSKAHVMQQAVFESDDTSSGVSGSIILSQNKYNPGEETSVAINLAYVNSNLSSVSHLYSINENTVAGDDCNSTGDTFNPTGLNGGSEFSFEDYGYVSLCSVSLSFYCEIGALGYVSKPTAIPNVEVLQITNVPLTGDMSVSGKSLVINEPLLSPNLFKCTNLKTVDSDDGGADGGNNGGGDGASNNSDDVKQTDGNIVVIVLVVLFTITGAGLLLAIYMQSASVNSS